MIILENILIFLCDKTCFHRKRCGKRGGMKGREEVRFKDERRDGKKEDKGRIREEKCRT